LVGLLAERWGIYAPILNHFSRTWDVQFLNSNRRYLQDEFDALYKRGQVEIARQILVPKAKEPAESTAPIDRSDREAKAVVLLQKHPEWSDRAVAKEVGCSPSTLSRSALYQKAKQLKRGTPPPRGWKNANGDIDTLDN